MGPEGPQGTQGEIGADGPGTRLVFSGQLDYSGAGAVTLPQEAGSVNDPPAVSCFISEAPNATAWLVVATSNLTGSCGIVQSGISLKVGIVESEAFWYFKVVVVY